MTQDTFNRLVEKHKHWLLNNGNDAHFKGQDLRGISMRGKDLREADMSRANLTGVDLSGADLRKACLINADLTGADLTGANITDANLEDAVLHKVKGFPEFPLICPENGAFYGYTFGWTFIRHRPWPERPESVFCIVKLEIPETAKRISGNGKKCRCDTAKVSEILTLEGKHMDNTWASPGTGNPFSYRVGETLKASDFDMNRWNYSNWNMDKKGYVFFISYADAADYIRSCIV